MIFTNDIYRFVGDAILADGYKDIRIVPIDVIEEKINEFLRMKLYESDTSLDNTALLKKLESFIERQHNKDQMMSVFTFYLLWYMSMYQEREIIWRIEDVDIPYLRESKFAPGKIDSLVTKEDIDYVDTFNFVLQEVKKLTNNESRGR